jgi:serine/threonine-protein kinase
MSHEAPRVACPHCGGSHNATRRRCTKTGRALGGDTRLLGQLIDKRYRIVRLLGDGPFGAVYKAEHVTVGRHVALRILPSTLVANPNVLHRFFREARLMSSVAGRRLHPLVDAGLSQEGLAYVAYEYVRGRSFAAALTVDAPMRIESAATILCDVLEGLAALHESGFVHRAVSPESVLLQMNVSGVERAVLTNFGAGALEVDASHGTLGEAVEIAELPRVFVPPAYVPPERSKGAAPHRREDIFGAGVTLAAALSPEGQPRFGSELVRLGVPPAIEAIIARAAATNVAARFDTAVQMRQTLVSYCGFEEEEPSSVTETHKSDLRSLNRRERRRGTMPARDRLRVVDVTGQGLVMLEADFGLTLLRAARATAGARWPLVLEELPDLDLYLASEETPRVPLTLLAATLEVSDARLGANDRLYCTLVGERAVKDELFTRVTQEHGQLTPELFIDQIATQWAKKLGHKGCRATHIGRGYGRIELREHREPFLAVCACFTGMLMHMMHKLGARAIEVNKTACEAVGDPACIYGATWM